MNVRVGPKVLTVSSALLVSTTLVFLVRFLAFLKGFTSVEVDATFEGEVDGSEYGVAAV